MSDESGREVCIECGDVHMPEEPSIKAKRADPCALVIFGVTGDLARRKLVPALYHLARAGSLPERFANIAVYDDLTAAARALLAEAG